MPYAPKACAAIPGPAGSGSVVKLVPVGSPRDWGQIAGVAQAAAERGEEPERLCLDAAGKHAHKDENANTV